MNETVPVGAFLVEPGKRGFGKSKTLSYGNATIHGGSQTLHLILDRAFAGIGPYNEWIDRNSDDNVTDVSGG